MKLAYNVVSILFTASAMYLALAGSQLTPTDGFILIAAALFWQAIDTYKEQ